MAIITSSKKRQALKLLAQGRVTVSEMSRLAGISQQMMHTYARQAEIDPVAARRRYLEDLWQSEEKAKAAAIDRPVIYRGITIEPPPGKRSAVARAIRDGLLKHSRGRFKAP